MVEFTLTDRQYELLDDKTRFLLITGSAGSTSRKNNFLLF